MKLNIKSLRRITSGNEAKRVQDLDQIGASDRLDAPTILIPRKVSANIDKSLGCCPHTQSRWNGKDKNNPLERINPE